MALGRWADVSPELELDLEGIKRLHPLPLGTLEALDTEHRTQREKFYERREQALTAVVKDEFHQRALELHAELEADESWRDRASVREAVSSYLLHTVWPWAVRDRGFDGAKEYLLNGQALEDARKSGLWGVDPHEAFIAEDDRARPSLLWTGRAGLVKLCPDDARNEGQRVSKMYGERLKLCDDGGYVLRYAVFSLPNYPQHHLGSGIDEIKKLFKERITHALRAPVIERDRRGRPRSRTTARNMRDEGRLFPDLVGALCCIEAPLSGRYLEGDFSNAWNVHLNAILVFRKSADQPFGRPDYEPIRAAWGADVHFAMIPQGDSDATAAALRECIKYPLQTVATKSQKRKVKRDRFGNVLTAAPPLIEWPPELFDEWWRAFKGVRRAWSCGLLYSRKMRFTDELVIELSKPEKRDPDRIEFFGTVRLSSTEWSVSRPRRDFREMEREKRRKAFEHRARLATDPVYAEEYRVKTERASRRLEHLALRNAAERALLTLILGNNSAEKRTTPVGERLRAARGPP